MGTVDIDEEDIRRLIREEEAEEERLRQQAKEEWVGQNRRRKSLTARLSDISAYAGGLSMVAGAFAILWGWFGHNPFAMAEDVNHRFQVDEDAIKQNSSAIMGLQQHLDMIDRTGLLNLKTTTEERLERVKNDLTNKSLPPSVRSTLVQTRSELREQLCESLVALGRTCATYSDDNPEE